MQRQQRILLAVMVPGGLAVLASYAYGLLLRPADAAALWGGVPGALLPFYQANMLLAAAGYLAYTYFLLFRVDAGATQVAGRFGFGLFPWLYALILVPSAAWMPLTLVLVRQPVAGLWLAIRLVLAAVALGSLGLAAALLTLRPRQPAWAYWLAVTGSLPFCVQTVVLDALVWPAFFPAPA